ncbi:DUF202 domain-containing protein [Specibacter cremeus]|uniref:DUF202 domain-containing protein n=1 Tax=Specibacter cremeus TaxID=1629051 RepID=UPI000F766998|nr:DUF202 domain-containing protein [Specibacter cremeus]
MSTGEAPARDPGLQPERTALSWKRTLFSAVVADLFIWRAWIHGMSGDHRQAQADGLLAVPFSAHTVALGVCAVVACLTTITLVLCAVRRVTVLRYGVEPLGHPTDIAPDALTLRTASAAIVMLAVAAICAIALGI